VNQQDYLDASAARAEFQRRCLSMFGCGTPLETDAGMPRGPDLAAARTALVAAGVDFSRSITILHPGDAPGIAALGLVSQGLLTQLGFRVELATMDLNTWFGRRNRPEGWHLFHTTNTVPDMQSPLQNPFLARGFAGWADDAVIATQRAAYAAAPDAAARRAVAEELHRRAAEAGFYMPLGQFVAASAWRAELQGVLPGPAMFLWNLSRP
jgi:peptide/nickel transport system substrate-binding protein